MANASSFHRRESDAVYYNCGELPGQFQGFVEAVSLMQRKQPNYFAHDLAKISVPVVIAQASMMRMKHASYSAKIAAGRHSLAQRDGFGPMLKCNVAPD